jgi:hypothetical protein
MTEIQGRQIPRAKPIHLTFYDRLKEHPYRTTLYVRDDITHEDAHRLIQAVCDVSVCVLAQYTIGYEKFFVPDYRQKLDELASPNMMGTPKWKITYHSQKSLAARSVTIPGRSVELSLGYRIRGLKKQSKLPDTSLPVWQNLIKVFRELCVTEEGDPIADHIELGFVLGNWPPKGWKNR